MHTLTHLRIHLFTSRQWEHFLRPFTCTIAVSLFPSCTIGNSSPLISLSGSPSPIAYYPCLCKHHQPRPSSYFPTCQRIYTPLHHNRSDSSLYYLYIIILLAILLYIITGAIRVYIATGADNFHIMAGVIHSYIITGTYHLYYQQEKIIPVS